MHQLESESLLLHIGRNQETFVFGIESFPFMAPPERMRRRTSNLCAIHGSISARFADNRHIPHDITWRAHVDCGALQTNTDFPYEQAVEPEKCQPSPDSWQLTWATI